VYTSQRANNITSSTLQARLAGDNLKGLAKARFESQLVKTNRALVNYAAQLAEDDLLPTRLPEKIQKAKWLKPKKTHDKATRRSMTGAEVAEQAANKAEKAATRPVTPGQVESDEDDGIVVASTPPRFAGESQGGTTITLAIRTPERLRPPPELTPALEASPEVPPEPTELPAFTATARMEQGRWKRRRVPNKQYTNSQYEL
jgi:ribosomal 50S subunit-recycling heat shock protein